MWTTIILNEHICILTHLHIYKMQNIVSKTFYIIFFSAALRLILTKQNKIVQQNQIIMAKITIVEKKICQETSHYQLSNETKDKLCKIFIIKTVNDLEEFDASLKKKKVFWWSCK